MPIKKNQDVAERGGKKRPGHQKETKAKQEVSAAGKNEKKQAQTWSK
jgi:hypothetical protein